MIVKMYMSRDVQTVTPQARMSEAIVKMKRHKIRRLIVVNDSDNVVGVVCHRDIALHFPSDSNPFSVSGLDTLKEDKEIADLISNRVISIEQDRPIEEAAKKMSIHRIGGLPVVHRDKLVGVITESDIFRVFTELLSRNEQTARVTFDLEKKENIWPILIDSAQKYDLNLLSFLRYKFNDRLYGVAQIYGDSEEKIGQFVEALWLSGYSVENVLRG